MSINSSDTPFAKAIAIGERLKQARLNRDMTQTEVSEQSGVERRKVLNAEKGKVMLEDLIAIVDALGMGDAIDGFIPPQPISPIQLLKLKGKTRKRASGGNKKVDLKIESKGDIGW